MAIRGPFPNKNADFNDYVDTTLPYLNTHKARLGVTDAHLNVLNPLYNNGGVAQNLLGWSQLWPLHINDDNNTKTINTLVATRRAQIEARMRLIYDDIPNTNLTAGDRITLRLPARDTTPTDINPAAYSPVLTMDKIVGHTHILRIADPTNPETQAMPEGNNVKIENFVGAKGLSGGALVFGNEQTTGKFLITFAYTEDDAGKTAYYRPRYYTKRGNGEWGAIFSAVIA